MVVLRGKGVQKPYRTIFFQAAVYKTVRQRTIAPFKKWKEKWKILKQIFLRLANYEENITTGNNPNSTSGIYIAAVKVAQYSMVDDHRREKEEKKRKHKRIQTLEIFFFNKINLKLFSDSKTAWTTSHLPLKKHCLPTSFISQPTPSRTYFSTSEVSWATSQIKEGQQ